MRPRLFLFLGLCGWLSALTPPLPAQPYGIEAPEPVGPFLNDAFPRMAPGGDATWTVEVAFTNTVFNQPMFLTPHPRTNRLMLIEKPGRIIDFPARYDATDEEARVFLDIRSRTFTVSDSGMTGLAFHPEFGQEGSPNRGSVYVTYKWRPSPGLGANPEYAYWRLSRFTVPDGQSAADPNSEMVMIQQFDRQMWHDAGCMMFGQDGYLYFSCGDEGGANDEFNVTQKLDERLMSGMFRIDVDNDPGRSHPIRRQPFQHPDQPEGWPDNFTTGYSIPDDNPFVNPDGSVLEEYYALGLRNPYRFSQDPVTGRIWIGDVGQGAREEVNLLEARANYQWAFQEGTAPGPKAPPATVEGVEKPPLWDYGRSEGGSIIGGHVYRGLEHAPYLSGRYIAVDNVSGAIWAIRSDDGETLESVDLLTHMPPGSIYGGTSSCGLDHEGEIYFLKFGGTGGGRIFKLARVTTPSPEPPALLSQTGAFDDLEELLPAPGLHPYTVNSPLWSDAASKQRWIAVPNDGAHDSPAERVGFSETGEWTFPPGTVFVKHFDLAADDRDPTVTQRLETRFLVMDEAGGAYGVTYRWRADHSDADLLPDRLTADYSITNDTGGLRAQTWEFPGRQDCITCHNAAAGDVLGVKTHQLNGDFTYAETGRTDNQLRALGHLGLLSAPFDESQIDSYPRAHSLDEAASPLVDRVRSYLDANCAQCHRPDGGARAAFDARYSTPLDQQGLIHGPLLNSSGDPEDRVVRPGDVARSVLHGRMDRVGDLQMPPLARRHIDTQAVELIAQWIGALPPGPGVSLTLEHPDLRVVSGPFIVFVQMTEPVGGLTEAQFSIENGNAVSLSGSGLSWLLEVQPVEAGEVTVQLPAGSVSNTDGEFNYASNLLRVDHHPHRLYVELSAAHPSAGTASWVNESTVGPFARIGNPEWVDDVEGTGIPGVRFDGNDDAYEGPVTVSDLDGDSDRSIEVWALNPEVASEESLVSWGHRGSLRRNMTFNYGNHPGWGAAAHWSDDLGWGETVPAAGEWHHLVYVYSEGTAHVFVNGELRNTKVLGGPLDTYMGEPINLACQRDSANGGRELYYSGYLNTVRIYGSALGEDEVLAGFLAGPARGVIVPTVTLATLSEVVTGRFQVRVNFSEPVTGFDVEDVILVNGSISGFSGSGADYQFTVVPSGFEMVEVRVPADSAQSSEGPGNAASASLWVSVLDPGLPLDALAGYWRLDESGGVTARDGSGNDNHGVLINQATPGWLPGLFQGALRFAGADDYVRVSNTVAGAFTLSLWIRTDMAFPETTNTYEGTGIVWADVGGTADDFILGGTRSASGVNRISFFTGNPRLSINGSSDLAGNTWTHVAAVRGPGADGMRIFVNGQVEASGMGGTAPLTANPEIHIGGNTLNDRYFAGTIDELRLYNRVLSDAEIFTLASAADPYALWAERELSGVAAEQRAPGADPDGDGRINLVEFAFATNPLLPDVAPMEIWRDAEGVVRFSHRRRTDAPRLRYRLHVSEDLQTWQAAGDEVMEEGAQSPDGAAYELVTIRVEGSATRRFIRVGIEY